MDPSAMATQSSSERHSVAPMAPVQAQTTGGAPPPLHEASATTRSSAPRRSISKYSASTAADASARFGLARDSAAVSHPISDLRDGSFLP
jgi:hypothetical protein